jgi:hypothetical protein
MTLHFLSMKNDVNVPLKIISKKIEVLNDTDKKSRIRIRVQIRLN